METRRFSGSSIPDNYVSESNSISLVFRSDVSVTRTGFQLRHRGKFGLLSEYKLKERMILMLNITK